MSCSGRFVRAFERVLGRYTHVSEHTIAALREQSQRPRVGIAESYDALAQWVRETGDEDLGLKAGEMVRFGEGGALDFAMRSASSLRCGVEVASRHARLFSDAFEPKLELVGERAVIRLDSKLPWPRAAADFTLTIFYANHIRGHLPPATSVEVWFGHAKPANAVEYERVFEGAELRFDAPCYGIVFDRALADEPLLSSDPPLHATHCQHLHLLQTRLEKPLSFAAQVRELMAFELRRGRPTSGAIARRLQIRRRTLVRRLHQERTTFKAQLDELRHELALDLVTRQERTLREISAFLRFSHLQAFHRAFRRWTGRTPAQYREHRQQEPAMNH